MKLLVTGGAGFIGSHLCDRLIEHGHEVTIIDDLSTGRLENLENVRNHPNFHLAIEDITNEIVMDRLVFECDAIYHLAAAVGVELIVNEPVEVIQRNIIGSDVVFRMANRYKKKVFVASTSEIYGKNEKVPFKETDDRLLGPTTKSRWSYSCSKAIDEFLALAYYKEKQLPVIIGRFFNTIGPRQTGQYGMVAPRFVGQALKGQDITVYGDGQQSRCFTYVGDVVKAIMDLLDDPKAVGEIYNIGGDFEITIHDLAKKVIEITGSSSQIKFVPYDEAYESGFEDMRRRIPDLTKIKNQIDYAPNTDIDEILNLIAEDLKKQK